MIWTAALMLCSMPDPRRMALSLRCSIPCQSPMLIYRPGAVTRQADLETAGPVEVFKGSGELHETPPEALPSPGVGLRHYAPRARLVLVEGTVEPRSECGLPRLLMERQSERLESCCLRTLHCRNRLHAAKVFPWGRWSRSARNSHGTFMLDCGSSMRRDARRFCAHCRLQKG